MANMDLQEIIERLERRFESVEPDVRAFLPEEGRFVRLRSEAEALLKRYPRPETRPPLFGLAIGVKDIFHTDGFPTRAGSQLPPDLLTGLEAESVTRLKNAGALIFGKTVTTEFAYFAPGPTRNPHNLDHTPGGSSSGSAAAVAAGMVPLALGTQTIGSIIRPASFCGVIGFKPTYERISRAGVIPLAPSVDHVGFFTADVETTIRAARVLCYNWQDRKIVESQPVLGVPTGPYLEKPGAEMRDHFEAVCNRLERAGFGVKWVPAMADFEEIYDRHNLLVAVEAAQTHRVWYAELGDHYHPKTADLIERGRKADPRAYQSALLGRSRLREELTTLMAKHQIDLWLSPSALGPAPYGLESTGDPVMNLPWTHCGFPTFNIPAGNNPAGLPMGLQLSARWNADEQLLAWGKTICSVL